LSGGKGKDWRNRLGTFKDTHVGVEKGPPWGGGSRKGEPSRGLNGSRIERVTDEFGKPGSKKASSRALNYIREGGGVGSRRSQGVGSLTVREKKALRTEYITFSGRAYC